MIFTTIEQSIIGTTLLKSENFTQFTDEKKEVIIHLCSELRINYSRLAKNNDNPDWHKMRGANHKLGQLGWNQFLQNEINATTSLLNKVATLHYINDGVIDNAEYFKAKS